MKKKLLYCGSLFLLCCGCAKVAQLLTFDITDSETIQIPPSSPVNMPVVSPVPVTMNSQQTFQNNHTMASLVKDVSLRKLTLSITSPSSSTFDFLKSIKIYIGTSTSDTVLLAAEDNIPMGVSSLELVPGSATLDKYVKASNYTLYTQAALRATVSQQTSLQANSRFQVTANAF